MTLICCSAKKFTRFIGAYMLTCHRSLVIAIKPSHCPRPLAKLCAVYLALAIVGEVGQLLLRSQFFDAPWENGHSCKVLRFLSTF